MKFAGSASGKHAHVRLDGVVARAAHKQQLLKLREALNDAQATPQSTLVAKTLQKLQQKWSAADQEAQTSPDVQAADSNARKGIRRLPGAMEYDLTIMDDSDDEFDDEEGPSTSERRIPREMKYFDTASINIKAGDGGAGCCAFRREKFVAHGGPNGGNGGDGGSVWAIAEDGMTSLTAFRNSVHWKAENGENGQGKDMHGRKADDLYIKVPVGTIIRRKGHEFDEQPLAELIQAGDKALLLQGGRGGRGNAAFKSGKNKAPVIAEDGEEGQELWLDLELKLVADVGIIGVPNAGKSTLLSVLSSARPKIADYPFTTLVPNLGVCELDYQTTVFADVPGILEGAHRGHGLGHDFLRHVSRARALVHVLDGTSPDALYDYRAIRMELRLFSPELAKKPQIVAYNKIDVPDSGDYVSDMVELLVAECGVQREHIVPVSAATGQGVLELVRAVRAMLKDMPDYISQLQTDALNIQEKTRSATDAARMDDFTIEAELGDGRTWYVYSEALERFAQMTNWDYFEAVLRFQRVLEACGVSASLRKRGCVEGDAVVIGGVEFAWSDDQSDGALYEAWIDDLNSRGRVGKGSQRWPHLSG